MFPVELLPTQNNFSITAVTITSEVVALALTSTNPTACCSKCGQPSDRVHSRYRRTLADLPMSGRRFILRVLARRFFCINPGCARAIFCERLIGVAAAHARSTARLADLHRAMGLDLGGEPGSRLAERLGAPASGDTILRRVKTAFDRPERCYRFVGIDDFAFRKGQTYGTILVDLERRQVIDLFDGRDGSGVEGWLKTHTSVEVITRDRWSAYAAAASAGAPQAIQVADRWHLLKNLREMIERLFERFAGPIRHTVIPQETAASEADASSPPSPVPVLPSILSEPTPDDRPKPTAGRLQREENHCRVHQLYALGYSLREIARQMRLSRNVVRRYLRTERYTDGRGTRKRKTRLDGFTPYVDQRIREGCRNAAELHRELSSRGSRSSACAVLRFLNRRMAAVGIQRERTNATRPPPPSPPSTRQLSYEFIRRPSDRSTEEQSRLDRLRSCNTDVGQGLELGVEFAQMVRRSSTLPLADWLKRAESSGVPELQAFAEGLRQDEAAVSAAIREEWSNGQVEGHVNRLKLIKRSAFGRAGFQLLRARVRAGS